MNYIYIFYYVPGMTFWASSFFPVCLWISGKKNFNLRHIFWTVRDKDSIWHAHSTNKILSNDTKVNDLHRDLYT